MDIVIFLKEYWAIVTALAGLILSYARMESAIRSLKTTDEEQGKEIERLLELHNKDVHRLQTDIKAQELQFKKIEISLESLKVNVEFIRETIKEIKCK
jgi:septal ring factor EnvC (AmiA/AmiB activator)